MVQCLESVVVLLEGDRFESEAAVGQVQHEAGEADVRFRDALRAEGDSPAQRLVLAGARSEISYQSTNGIAWHG